MIDDFSFYTGKSVLITGGLGFLGSSLALKVHESGGQVTIYDDLVVDEGANWFNIEPIRKDTRVIEANLREREKLDEAVKGMDVVFHFAGHSSHVDSMKEPYYDVETNIVGHLNLLEACRKNNPTVKYVYCGTRAQYGITKEALVTEDHPMFPMDIYGVNKLAGEHYIFLYQKICGLRATSIRLSNTYGPRHQMRHAKYGVQNYLLRLALDGKEITIFEPGTQRRDYIYIDDTVRAFLYAGKDVRSDGQAYNVGSGNTIVFYDLAQLMTRLAGSGTVVLKPLPGDRVKIETGDFIPDCTKIKQHLGYAAVVSLEDGLQRTIDFYRENKAYYWT